MGESWETQAIDLDNITDDELYKVLQRLGISAGPIVDSTRQFYKKIVNEKMGELDEFDRGNTLNETTCSGSFILHESSKHNSSSGRDHSSSQESEGGTYRPNFSSPATEEAMRLAMHKHALSRESSSELKQGVKHTGMSIHDIPYTQQTPSLRVRTLPPGKAAGFEKHWEEMNFQKNYATTPVQTGRSKNSRRKMMLLLIKIIGVIILLSVIMYYVWKASVSSNSMLIDSDENPTTEDDLNSLLV